MSGISDFNMGRRARRLRVDTLVRLRWLAVAGQSAAVVITFFGLGFQLPVGFCFVLIAISAWLNIGLRLRFPVSHRVDDAAAFKLLAFDILQLDGLLYLSGGLANPFSLLVLAPIIMTDIPFARRPSTAWRSLWLNASCLRIAESPPTISASEIAPCFDSYSATRIAVSASFSPPRPATARPLI